MAALLTSAASYLPYPFARKERAHARRSSPSPARPLASAPVTKPVDVTAAAPAPATTRPPGKRSIAIIGGGTGGIGALVGLLGVPEDVRKNWSIDVFERRDNIGGVWYPDYEPPVQPNLPESPLYASLATNTPAPTMTLPHLPIPDGTDMFPSHEGVLAYHHQAYDHFRLKDYFRFKHAVASADWIDKSQKWQLELQTAEGKTVRQFDHLIIAVGRYRYPHIVNWDGQDEWLKGGDRKIAHSLWFRDPEAYAGRDVIVVGFGASGWDMASKIAEAGNAIVYHSYSTQEGIVRFPPIPKTIHKPRISHFTPASVVFTDGTELASDKVSILLGTGYSLEIPFFKPLARLDTIDPASTSLAGNGNYIRPLHLDLFAYDPRWPRNALAIIALPYFIANFANDYIQGLTVGHAIADEDALATRAEARRLLEAHEKAVADAGHDVFQLGHKFTAPGQAEAYQNNLADLLRKRSKVALPEGLSDPYVEEWRVWARGPTEHGVAAFVLKRGWQRAKAKGVDRRFVEGKKTEEDWDKAMRELFEWEVAQNEKEPWSLTRLTNED